jgi:hypothetical protein
MAIISGIDSFGHVGFTCDLKATLIDANCILDKWISQQVSEAEERGKYSRTQLQAAQDFIDRTSVDILALRIDAGLGLGDRNSTDLNNGISSKVSFSEQIRNLDDEKEHVMAIVECTKQKIQGTCTVIYFTKDKDFGLSISCTFSRL